MAISTSSEPRAIHGPNESRGSATGTTSLLRILSERISPERFEEVLDCLIDGDDATAEAS